MFMRNFDIFYKSILTNKMYTEFYIDCCFLSFSSKVALLGGIAWNSSRHQNKNRRNLHLWYILHVTFLFDNQVLMICTQA